MQRQPPAFQAKAACPAPEKQDTMLLATGCMLLAQLPVVRRLVMSSLRSTVAISTICLAIMANCQALHIMFPRDYKH